MQFFLERTFCWQNSSDLACFSIAQSESLSSPGCRKRTSNHLAFFSCLLSCSPQSRSMLSRPAGPPVAGVSPIGIWKTNFGRPGLAAMPEDSIGHQAAEEGRLSFVFLFREYMKLEFSLNFLTFFHYLPVFKADAEPCLWAACRRRSPTHRRLEKQSLESRSCGNAGR